MNQNIDVQRARLETPASNHCLHFNNAGASLTPLPVQHAIAAYQEIEYNLGGYEACDKHLDDHKAVYEKLGKFIHASTSEIVLTTSASHSYGIAIQSLRLKPGDKVLCCHAEYISNYMALLLQQQAGVEIVVVPNDGNGTIDLEELDKLIDPRTKLISLTHVPTSGGLVNPAEEVGKIARKHGVLYMLDACQSVGQIDVDVTAIGCDFLAATGRKYLRGPRGTGFLFVRKELFPRLSPAIIDGWSADWTALNEFQYRSGRARLELYERNYAACLGLGAAAEYAHVWGIKNIEARNIFLAATLREKLAAIKGVLVRDKGIRKGAIVTFTMDGKDHAKVHAQLCEESIHTSVSDGRAARLDLALRGIDSVLRASVHYYNTEEEIERFAARILKF